MRLVLILKGAIILAMVTLLLAVGGAYAITVVFDKNVTGTVQVAVSDAIQVYEMDGTTVVTSIDFGTASVDPFGSSSTPTHKVVVKNLSNTVVTVEVTGDRADNLLPLFGPTELDPAPAPGNAFTLQPAGQSGDMTMGWVGLKLLTPNTGSRTTTITFRASASIPLKVAVECKTGSNSCNIPTESAFKIEEVIEASGDGIADVVDGSEIDTLAELANYDVVIVGSSGSSDGDPEVFQTPLKQWVQNGGGVVATGWINFRLDTVALLRTGDLADILPLTPSSAGFTDGGTITITGDTSHPVINGISNFTSPHWNDYGPPKPGATVLATDSGGNPAVAVWTFGAGRVVYLSPIYYAYYAGYVNEPLLDGSTPDAVNLFLQAVEWAAGVGPSEPLSQPASPEATAPPAGIAPASAGVE